MELFYHPLSRNCQTVLIALYEKQARFMPRIVAIEDPNIRRQFIKQHPSGRLPLLRTDRGDFLPEPNIIIEYLDHQYPSGTQLIPKEFTQALQVRLLERQIDIDLNNKLFLLEQKQLSLDTLPLILQGLKNEIQTTLAHLNHRLHGRHWLCGDHFTLADCALIPCLMAAKNQFKLYLYYDLDKYLHLAETRGAWIQVQEEIELTSRLTACPIP
ncbi:glutathione S-transferase family protein [Shewanella sp. AS1]|uniref:glutathione S-transferase family protein n=1 Tax=Shewanella sp. AS1 TaxID=2907626 RepID=UPI001F389601|nr:glutathione S-transferase family protein [Shewanella sp. AS1]MCE9679679.1 glutathione S-transferase family protein [Shewanella sp. AS1]